MSSFGYLVISSNGIQVQLVVLNDKFSQRAAALSDAGSSISFLIIFPNAALSSSFDPTLMNRTTPRRSIKNVVGMLETE